MPPLNSKPLTNAVFLKNAVETEPRAKIKDKKKEYHLKIIK